MGQIVVWKKIQITQTAERTKCTKDKMQIFARTKFKWYQWNKYRWDIAHIERMQIGQNTERPDKIQVK